jgi:Rieske 2Fe-2S family protein
MLRTLPAACYLSDDVWSAERERVWFTQWVAVARAEDVEHVGDRVLVDVAGESVIVVRASDPGLGGAQKSRLGGAQKSRLGGAQKSRLHAFYNVCQHRGCELVDRDGPAHGSFGRSIRCPYHGWTYDLDGTLRATPFVDRPEPADGGPITLSELAVAEWGGFVFVADSPGVAVDVQLGPVAERVRRYPLAELRRGQSFRYEVAANWKVIAENYNECYHCAPVHPELCGIVPAFRRGGAGLEWEDGITHREGAWTLTMSGTSTRRPFADLDERERTRHKGEVIYPNLLLSLSAEHVASFRLVPHGPGATIVECDLLFHADELAAPSFDPSDAGDLWDLVNRQDWTICERVQRGMASRGWRGGWFAPMEDESADITRWYRRLMGDAVPADA